MGRTLHYRVLGYALTPDAVTKIKSVASAMNQRFTWSCENLSFVVADDEARRVDNEFEWFDRFPLQAQGFTKVADDEWNACLLTRFVIWLSTMLVGNTVTLLDEGRYIFAGHVVLQHGDMAFDPIRLSRLRGRLEERGDKAALGLLWTKVAAARQGRFFEPCRAQDYADRKEIAALGISKGDLERMSLEEVAAQITFPWDEKPRPWEALKK